MQQTHLTLYERAHCEKNDKVDYTCKNNMKIKTCLPGAKGKEHIILPSAQYSHLYSHGLKKRLKAWNTVMKDNLPLQQKLKRNVPSILSEFNDYTNE